MFSSKPTKTPKITLETVATIDAGDFLGLGSLQGVVFRRHHGVLKKYIKYDIVQTEAWDEW